MRRASKADENQRAIVRALRSAGATVAYTHTVGMGFPDIVVGFRGVNYLLELKDGEKPASAQKLTPIQEEWHAAWNGAVEVVNSAEAALKAIGAVK